MNARQHIADVQARLPPGVHLSALDGTWYTFVLIPDSDLRSHTYVHLRPSEALEVLFCEPDEIPLKIGLMQALQSRDVFERADHAL